MKLIRYSLYFDDEPQVGFLVGLRDVGFSESKVNKLIYPFDKHLKIPDRETLGLKQGEIFNSYFTEQGVEAFKQDILKIQRAVRSQGIGFSVRKSTLTLPREDYQKIVYRDDYQVLIKWD